MNTSHNGSIKIIVERDTNKHENEKKNKNKKIENEFQQQMQYTSSCTK